MVLFGLLLALPVGSVVGGYVSAVSAAVDTGSTHLHLIEKSAQGTHISRQGPLHPATSERGGSRSLIRRALKPWQQALPEIARMGGYDDATVSIWIESYSHLDNARKLTVYSWWTGGGTITC